MNIKHPVNLSYLVSNDYSVFAFYKLFLVFYWKNTKEHQKEKLIHNPTLPLFQFVKVGSGSPHFLSFHLSPSNLHPSGITIDSPVYSSQLSPVIVYWHKSCVTLNS